MASNILHEIDTAFAELRCAIRTKRHKLDNQVRAIQEYVALSQGTLYNPRLSEMLRELLKEVRR